MVRDSKFHPVIMDTTGELRERFNAIHARTGVSKRYLAARIFQIGLEAIDKREKLTLQMAAPAMEAGK